MRFIFLFGALLILPVHSAVAEISWYLGAGGAITKLESVGFSNVSGLDAGLGPADSISSNEFKDDPLGWQVFGGVMFNENFGVVVKYNDSGVGKAQWTGSTTIGDTPPVTTVYTFDGEMEMKGYSLYAVQTVPFAKKFEFTVEGGVTHQELDWAWTSTAFSGSVSKNETNIALGMILRYKFLKHFAISGEIEYLPIDFDGLIDKPLIYGANLELHF
jgi:hypothetical protein